MIRVRARASVGVRIKVRDRVGCKEIALIGKTKSGQERFLA